MIYKRGKQWQMDATSRGERYRESLGTSDRREALNLEKKRIAEIQQGKTASAADREFARLLFGAAADAFLKERPGHVSERSVQFEKERLTTAQRVLRPQAGRDNSGRRYPCVPADALGSWTVQQDYQHGDWCVEAAFEEGQDLDRRRG
jgi:hypothetical protein